MADVGENESFMSSARNSSIINHNHFESPQFTQSVAEFVPKEVSYMLFIREPSRVEEKKLKAEKRAIMNLDSPEEQQMRDHIDLLLREVEPLTRVGKYNLNDPNSLSEIMSVIRQHTEKKKAFGDQDFINKILQNSIAQFFGRGS